MNWTMEDRIKMKLLLQQTNKMNEGRFLGTIMLDSTNNARTKKCQKTFDHMNGYGIYCIFKIFFEITVFSI